MSLSAEEVISFPPGKYFIINVGTGQYAQVTKFVEGAPIELAPKEKYDQEKAKWTFSAQGNNKFIFSNAAYEKANAYVAKPAPDEKVVISEKATAWLVSRVGRVYKFSAADDALWEATGDFITLQPPKSVNNDNQLWKFELARNA